MRMVARRILIRTHAVNAREPLQEDLADIREQRAQV
jgi:hypothetical protein